MLNVLVNNFIQIYKKTILFLHIIFLNVFKEKLYLVMLFGK